MTYTALDASFVSLPVIMKSAVGTGSGIRFTSRLPIGEPSAASARARPALPTQSTRERFCETAAASRTAEATKWRSSLHSESMTKARGLSSEFTIEQRKDSVISKVRERATAVQAPTNVCNKTHRNSNLLLKTS